MDGLNLKKFLFRFIDKVSFLKEMRYFLKFNLKVKKKFIRQLSLENEKNYKNLRQITYKRVLIPLIETSHYQFHQILILAKALEIRGAKVKVIVCDSFLPACEIKSVRTITSHPCVHCIFNQRRILSYYNLEILKLSELIKTDILEEINNLADILSQNYPVHYFYKGIDIIPMVTISITRYFYGGTATNKAELVKLRKANLITALMMLEVAEKIYNTWAPEILLNNMNVYTCWEPYYAFFKLKNGCNLFTVSVTAFCYHSIILNYGELYFSAGRFLKYCCCRKTPILLPKEKEELDKFLHARYFGKSDVFKQYSYFSNDFETKSNNYLRNEVLKYDKNKINLFLFTNVYWDVGVSDSARLFNNLISWVLETIKLVEKYPDKLYLYIKTHPAEKFDSASSLKTVIDLIREKYFLLPKNVTFILPEQKVNTYQLFPYINIGIVYNGTLGLEMLLNNVPVIAVAKAPYSNLGFACEPNDIDEYEKLLTGEKPMQKPFEKKDKLELFAYFYFIKTKIPWHLTKQAYADNFEGFDFDSLDALLPGENKYLDHLCNCILKSDATVIENWESDYDERH